MLKPSIYVQRFYDCLNYVSSYINPDNTGVLPFIEVPKYYTKEMGEVEERVRDRAVM